MLSFKPAPNYAKKTVQDLMEMGFEAFQKQDYQVSGRLETEIEKRLQLAEDINAELQIIVKFSALEKQTIAPLSEPGAIGRKLGESEKRE